MKLSEQVAAYQDVCRRTAHAVKEADALKREKNAAQQALYQRMQAEECQGFKYDGRTYGPTEKEYGVIQDHDAFARWCEEEGREDMYEPKPRQKLVDELVRERLRNGEALPEGLGFYVKETISNRAAGVKTGDT
jgi:hypothetical protein